MEPEFDVEMDDQDDIKIFNRTINELPDEVLEYILGLVSPYKDLRECMLVCKRWHQNVKNVIRLRHFNLAKAINNMDVAWQTITPVDMAPTITKRYSHSACYHENSMYVFGGCTATSTTFNDLWRLDLNKRQWVRPLTMGTYPSPKACATMVQYRDALILFGGWTHPSPYPMYQAWRLFNELHIYNIVTNRWMCINSPHAPPAMAGHSATVHDEVMVVFGGLKADVQGQYACSNDVWCFNFATQEWHKQQTSSTKPHIRYGQSQISLGKSHILIIGGCGGANMVFSDVWLLTMQGDVWLWKEVEVKNSEWSPLHMWCHPACKVGDKVVMMSRHPKATKTYLPYTGLSASRRPRSTPGVWVPPQEENVVNGIPERAPNANPHRGSTSHPVKRTLEHNSSDVELAKRCDNSNAVGNSSSNQHQPCTSYSSGSIDQPSTSSATQSSGPPPTEGNDLSNPNKANSNSKIPITSPPGSSRSSREQVGAAESVVSGGSRVSNLEMAAFREQSPRVCPSRPRERQLQALQRFQDRIRLLQQARVAEAPEVEKPPTPPRSQRTMAVFVMDITHVLDDESHVSWLAIRADEPTAAGPEETILYTLVAGKGELVMFGGILKDAVSITTQIQPSSTNNVSNSLHFISAPRGVI